MFFLFFLFSSHVSLQRVKHLSLSMSTYVFTYVYFIDIAFGRVFFSIFSGQVNFKNQQSVFAFKDARQPPHTGRCSCDEMFGARLLVVTFVLRSSVTVFPSHP